MGVGCFAYQVPLTLSYWPLSGVGVGEAFASLSGSGALVSLGFFWVGEAFASLLPLTLPLTWVLSGVCLCARAFVLRF